VRLMSAVGDARIRIPDRITRGETILVNSIISHPMDTGFFRTPDGKPIPAWFIKDVVVKYGDEEVARFEWTSGISRDPVVSFMLKVDKEAPLTMVWTDTKGSTFTKTVNIAFASA
jgi:sulfur-oxidizing protein SoxZ